MYIVYKYTFPDNKVYIGRTKNELTIRSGSNGRNYKNQPLVGKAIKDFGWDNIKKEIIYSNLTLDGANRLEQELIKKYNATSIEFGYNMTIGGNGGGTVSKYRKPMSEETKKKIGENSRRCLTGRTVPKETREKLSNALKGHIVTQETRDKIRIANTGKTHSLETRKKISKNNKMHDPNVRKKVSESLKKSGSARAVKRLETMKRLYPDGFKQSKKSNELRSKSLTGTKKSEETRKKMSNAAKIRCENMRNAKNLGITYKEYISRIGGNQNVNRHSNEEF